MHSFVAVTDYPAQCPVEIVLIMYIAKAVYENKIRKAVDFNFASQPRYILILFLLFECFPDFAHNRHAAASRFCLRLVYAELTFVCIVLVVNKCVVDADKAVFKINIAPAQPRYLADTQTCINTGYQC